MPKTKVVFYQDDDRGIPVLEWLKQLPKKAQDKCVVKIERLAELGHELRRPEADYLRDTPFPPEDYCYNRREENQLKNGKAVANRTQKLKELKFDKEGKNCTININKVI